MNRILTTLALIFWTLPVFALEQHSKAGIVQDYDNFVSGMKIGVHIDIDKGWHAYWKNPGDVGSSPELQISSTRNVLQSDINYPIPSRIESNPYDSFGYMNETLFYKTISLDDAKVGEKIHLEVRADWLLCKDICVPSTKIFQLDVTVADKPKQMDEHFKYFSFPQETTDIQTGLTSEGKQNILTISSKLIKKDSALDFFPEASMTGIFNKPISKEIGDGKAVFYYQHVNAPIPELTGVLKINEKEAYWIGKAAASSPPPEPLPLASKSSPNLFFIFVLAFLGGILLNLMPCVLPVVSLKVLSILKSSHSHKQKIRSSNLWFSIGIVVSLVCFAFIFLGIQSGGQKLGWGFQLQSPGFVTFLILLFFVIGLNLIGFFEINSVYVPGLGKALSSQSRCADFIGGFFTTVVATPCSAPFMAAAIGYALTQNNWTVVATFFAMGLGLSFPYLLLSAFPSLIRFVPKPGAWMITLKEFLAFPMFLTVTWLTWVLAQLTDNRAILSTLAALTLVALFVWVRKKIFNRQHLQKKMVLLVVAAGIFMAARIPLSKQADDGISWELFHQSNIDQEAKTSIVFVDFTADWCLTCKTNERITFSNPEVIQAIQTAKVKMIKADWTKQNPEITAVLQKYERAGVPFYLLYKPTLTTPMVLPTLLTPSIFIDAITSKETHEN